MLQSGIIWAALRETGTRLLLARPVEILIVGGAAGVLLGELPPAWATADVDVIHCHLPQDRETVLNAAADAGRALGLPASWLSDDVGLYVWTLPSGWESRRVEIGSFGLLKVFAASRRDLVAMKFIAHRERDLEHLMHLKVRLEELRYVRGYLESLLAAYPAERGRIEMARQYLDAWEPS